MLLNALRPVGPFLAAQDSEWYPLFLQSIVEHIRPAGDGLWIDIGTGPGALPAALCEQPGWKIIGTDIDPAMLQLARQRVRSPDVHFQLQNADFFASVANASVDRVSFCSVLFLLSEAVRCSLLDEALRMLKPEGQLLVLTPTPLRAPPSALSGIGLRAFARSNWTFFVWRASTRVRATRWHQENWAQRVATERGLHYAAEDVFSGYARLECLSKS
ncbi:MAG: class I SAM-dependent methyltransferase [Leptospirales bacterium]|nr:class I SAM-dependent methyltransferase [Leptospirales bacterium]